MNLTYHTSLSERLQSCLVLLDTTALVSASRNDLFHDFLYDLSRRGAILMTVPSARYEFTRMAADQHQLDNFNQMLHDLEIEMYDLDDNILITQEVADYLMLYNDCVNKSRSLRKAPSFTDSLLYIVLYLNRNLLPEMKLITGNSHDMPLQFFDRTDTITIDSGHDIHVEGVYSFNNTQFNKVQKSFCRK